MLTNNLLISRYRKGNVHPHRIKTTPEILEFSQSLIGIFKESKGRQRHEIEEDIGHLSSSDLTPKVTQGLVKLISDKATFSSANIEDPQRHRQNIFSQSVDYWKNYK